MLSINGQTSERERKAFRIFRIASIIFYADKALMLKRIQRPLLFLECISLPFPKQHQYYYWVFPLSRPTPSDVVFFIFLRKRKILLCCHRFWAEKLCLNSTCESGIICDWSACTWIAWWQHGCSRSMVSFTTYIFHRISYHIGQRRL